MLGAQNMMRVLQVVTEMSRGGLEAMLMNYYRHVDRSLVQFDFLTHRAEPGSYDEEIKSLGGIVYHLPRLNPFSPSYKKTLREFFTAHPEYRIVHVHQDCLSSVILREAARCHVPVRIAHSHCASQDKNLKYPIKLFYRHLIPKYATDLLSCGQEAGRWMFEGAPFSVINNAIDAAAFSFDPAMRDAVRKEWRIGSDELLIGHVGRFFPQKNHDYLLDIFFEIQKKAQAKLMLVGDGFLRPDIEQKIQALGIQDKVIMTGVRSDVARLFQAMDVFVFPSNYEGLPLTVIEAQAAGLPCLISDKVSPECKKTDLVSQIPLADSPEKWADTVIRQAETPRRNTYPEICRAKYDITSEAKYLMDFYMQKDAEISQNKGY